MEACPRIARVVLGLGLAALGLAALRVNVGLPSPPLRGAAAGLGFVHPLLPAGIDGVAQGSASPVAAAAGAHLRQGGEAPRQAGFAVGAVAVCALALALRARHGGATGRREARVIARSKVGRICPMPRKYTKAPHKDQKKRDYYFKRMYLHRVGEVFSELEERGEKSAPPTQMTGLKEVGSVMVRPKFYGEGRITSPAEIPSYQTPVVHHNLQRTRWDGGPPRLNHKYEEFYEQRCTLDACVEKAVDKAELADVDVIMDSELLTDLFLFEEGKLNGYLIHTHDRFNEWIDMMRVGRMEGTKAVVLEKVFHQSDLVSGQAYKGHWHTYDRSNQPYDTAFQALCTGNKPTGEDAKSLLWNKTNKSKLYRFIKFDVGGLKVLARSRIDAKNASGKTMVLKCRSWWHDKGDTHKEVDTIIESFRMLTDDLGEITIGLQRSGLLWEVLEVERQKLFDRFPALLEGTERRLGRAAAQLKKIVETANKHEKATVVHWTKGKMLIAEQIPTSGRHLLEREAVRMLQNAEISAEQLKARMPLTQLPAPVPFSLPPAVA